MEMVWEEPPARKQSEVQAMLEQLQANPGRWAMVHTQRGAGGGTATWWKKHGCEATTRSKDGVVKTYARWPETAAAPVPAPHKPQQTATAAKAQPVPLTRKKSITPAQVETMAQLHAEGWSFTAIGEEFGISRVMAAKHIRRHAEKTEATTDPVPAPDQDTHHDEQAPTLGSIRRATLVTQHTKGTCRTCGSRNRGLTDGVCRMCTIRAKEKAALTEDGSA